MQIFRIVLSIFVLAAGAALAQGADTVTADRSIVYGVSSVGGSGVSGIVYLGALGDDTTAVVVALTGTEPGASHPSHFHDGDCGSGGGIRIPLANISGDTGLGVTLVRTSLDAIVSSDFYLNVHASPENLQTIVACGEVGEGAARFDADDTRDAADDAADGAADTRDATAEPPTEEAIAGTPDTASYGLFPVEGSGIQGQVQLTEDPEGGTRFVVTLTGIEPSRSYPVALYRGDCGPDRPKVADLEPVGALPEDPHASVTQTDLSFDEITSGDYFMYVFRADDSDRIAACGEVGVGANR